MLFFVAWSLRKGIRLIWELIYQVSDELSEVHFVPRNPPFILSTDFSTLAPPATNPHTQKWLLHAIVTTGNEARSDSPHGSPLLPHLFDPTCNLISNNSSCIFVIIIPQRKKASGMIGLTKSALNLLSVLRSSVHRHRENRIESEK